MTHSGSESYEQFTQRVRAYPRTALLKAISEWGALCLQYRKDGKKEPLPVTDFALAGIARICISRGNEFRHGKIRKNTIPELCSRYFRIEDDRDYTSSELNFALTRYAFEQFSFQSVPYLTLARSYSLFQDYSHVSPTAPTPQEWMSETGLDFEDFLRAGFALSIILSTQGGVVSRSSFNSPDMRKVLGNVKIGQFNALIDQYYAQDIEWHTERSRYAELQKAGRWSHNPLQERPIISCGDELICPVPQLVLDRISPTSLYFVGQAKWGGRFTDSLGEVFEHYVGEQLRLIDSFCVYDEILYDKDNKRSCDYVVVTDQAVLLVEVKSMRSILSFRQGQQTGYEDTRKKFTRARAQLENTSTLIDNGHRDFRHIPRDIPHLGVVVTLEPFYLRESDFALDLLGGASFPISIASAQDLEIAVTEMLSTETPGVNLLTSMKSDSPHLPKASPGLDLDLNHIVASSIAKWMTWEDSQ